jgi:hypothetical protein
MSSADLLSGVGGEMGAVQVTMLKKAQNMEASQAAQLVQALPASPSPAGVGGKIDVTG